MWPDLKKLSKQILQGDLDLIVWGWGSKRDFTVFEWQRQVPAQFITDFEWKKWSGKTYNGLSMRSPASLRRHPADQALVFNNYYFTPSAQKIDDYLSDLGYRSLPPLHLHDMACRITGKRSSQATTRNFTRNVQDTLADMLTPPEALHKARHLPNVKKMARFFGSYTPQDYLAAALPELRERYAPSLRPRDGHVGLLIGALHSGGAERQICNLAIGLKRTGWTPTILVYETGDIENRYFRAVLAEEGIAYEMICPRRGIDPAKEALRTFEDVPADIRMALWHLRGEFVLRSIDVWKALRRLRPQFLISYLEWPNIFGSLGGLMAGMSYITMSGRLLAPPHFPHFYGKFTDSFRDIYRLALFQPGVVLNNNSAAGAKSYAKWLGIPARKIPVVYNCVTEEFLRPANPKKIAQKRRQLGLQKNQPLILGVFRLSTEKRPLDFVRIISILHRCHPDIRAILCGQDGNQAQETRDLIRKLKLNSTITLAGVVDDIPALMHASTILLHTSEAEGAANVILEAQAAGLPIVCTRFSGSLECLHKGWLPFTRNPGDIKGLAEACEHLLNQPKPKTAASAQAVTRKRHSLSRLTNKTLKTQKLHRKGKTRRKAANG